MAISRFNITSVPNEGGVVALCKFSSGTILFVLIDSTDSINARAQLPLSLVFMTEIGNFLSSAFLEIFLYNNHFPPIGKVFIIISIAIFFNVNLLLIERIYKFPPTPTLSIRAWNDMTYDTIHF